MPQKTLFEAIEAQDEAAVEIVLEQIVALAAEDRMTLDDITNLLASHDILPGSGFHNWVYQELSHKLSANNRELPKAIAN